MPADSRLTRERILKAAEKLFAEGGLEGTSLRAIAAEAGVQVALIHYHFGGRNELHRAVFATRYAPYADARDKRLPLIDYAKDQEAVVRDIVEIFMAPADLMLDPNARNFVLMFGREAADPKESERGVLNDFVDPTARVLLACLRRALPELSEADLAWGYQFMVGGFVLHALETDRTTRLSDGAAKSGDIASAKPAMIDYIVGGWMNLARTARGREGSGK